MSLVRKLVPDRLQEVLEGWEALQKARPGYALTNLTLRFTTLNARYTIGALAGVEVGLADPIPDLGSKSLARLGCAASANQVEELAAELRWVRDSMSLLRHVDSPK